MEASKEESLAKRPRMETQDAEQIIQNLQQVIQNLQAQLTMKDKRIHELEQKNLDSPLMESKPKILWNQNSSQV